MFSVFKKTFRDSQRTILWLSIGLGLYAIMIMSFYPSMIEQEENLNKLLESYPEEFISFFYGGVDDASEISISEPAGYLQSQFTPWMLLILGAVVIVQGFNTFTNAERDGSIDVMLSLPITRRDLLLGRLLSSITGTLLVLTACFLGFVVSKMIWSEFTMTITDIAVAIYGAFPVLLVITCFTYVVALFIPSSRHFAGAIAYLFLIGSYLLYGLSGLSDALKELRPLNLFDYYNVRAMVNEGLEPGKLMIIFAAAAVYYALAWWQVDRKELGV